MKKLSLFILLTLASFNLCYAQNTDKADISKVLADFETAIVENNQEEAGALLHDDVIILEGNGMETKSQYLSHHFHSDGKFLSAMNREQLEEHITVKGDVAWVSSKTNMTGTYNDRDIDTMSLELAVLVRTEDGWKITALHWS